MLAALGKSLFVIGMPIVLFLVSGYAMMQMTGRDQFRARGAAEGVPLNYRLKGYDAPAARAYWSWLGPEGRAAERRFLEADMAFPFLYGGAMLASLLLAWAWLGRPFGVIWLVAPVLVMVGADWIENVVHWYQLRNFAAGEAVHGGAIGIASTATSVKLVSFWIVATGVVALAVWLPFRSGGPAP